MIVKYLLDTNIVSEPLRASPNARVLERLKRNQDQLATASLVWHELRYGCNRLPDSAKRRAIEKYMSEVVAASMPILAYNQDAAEWHAVERARLAGIGKTPPFVDGQIMAIAAVNELVLVTQNATDYASFAGARVEDWSR